MNLNPSACVSPAANVPRPRSGWRRLAYPGTACGWVSVGLVILFLALLKFVIFWGAQTGHDRSTFFSDSMIAFALIGTAASGIAAGVVALIAVFRRERAIAVFLALLLGAFVLYFTIGALNGG